jgi:hypothetical protein
VGFEAPETTYRLKFADPEFEGLEVRVRAGTVGSMLRISHLPMDLRAIADNQEKLDLFLGVFAEHLASWNLERRGKPIPANREGIDSQELPFISVIVTEWLKAVIGIPDPLGEPSDNGDPALEASLSMETLSVPLTSTDEPDSFSDSVSDLVVSQAS